MTERAPAERWLNVADAATHLGLERKTVYRLVQQRKVRHYRIGAGGGKIAFRTADLDAYLKTCVVEADEITRGSAPGLVHLYPPKRARGA